MGKTILSEKKSNVSKIILNSPEKGNVLSKELLAELYEELNIIEKDKDTRVIVIEGKDGIFSKGMDFADLVKTKTNLITPFIDVLLKLRNSNKPVIALIDGEASGGGMGLILASDIIIASRRSSFSFTEVIFGLIPAIVMPLLLERVSFKKARYCILSSKKFTADEACGFGLIDDAVLETEIDKKLKEYLKRLLSSSPEALSEVKKYSDFLTGNKIKDQMAEGGNKLKELIDDEKNISAIAGFLEGEKLPWMGKNKD